MTALNPYLNFNGNTEEAFNFYKSIFGGEFIGGVRRFRDTPEGSRLPEHEQDKVMHIALPFGKGNMLMGTDALESMGYALQMGNNFHLTIQTESKEEADKLFNGLSDGGKTTMPMQDMFWGDYFGMLVDKFGVQWMVSYSTMEQ
jgi:PhnB protein